MPLLTLITPTEEEERVAIHHRIGLEAPPVKEPKAEPPQPIHPIIGPKGRNWLNESLLELSDTRPPKRTWDFVLAFSSEVFVIVVLILLPLMYTDAIDLKQFSATYLIAPPPPPPPPPPPAEGIIKARSVRRVFTQSGKLVAPSAVPTKIAMLKEEALPPDIGAVGVEGGVPGGVAGGQVGGVLGGILQEGAKKYQPIAPPTAPAKPVRVGGNIRPPRVVFSPQPDYPTLAKQAKVQGDVLINAIIDEQGNVVELKAVSGHPLLIHAALQAVSKWKYQPTILNGTPVAVELIVTVTFRLS